MKVDGSNDTDELYLIFIKEMGEVSKYFAIHPRETILSKSEPKVSTMVNPTKQIICMMNRFLNTDNGSDISVRVLD